MVESDTECCEMEAEEGVLHENAIMFKEVKSSPLISDKGGISKNLFRESFRLD